jgi:arsenate reductase
VTRKPVILFACVHNGGRSLAAKVLAEHYGGDAVEVRSAGETCPVFPGKTYEDWQLDDPKGQDVETVRRIVDEVDAHVLDLLSRIKT